MKITYTACAVLVFLAISWTNRNSGIDDAQSAQQKKIATVTIGSQVWMQKNLDVTRYRNGDVIPQVQDSAKWAKLTTGAWCWYKNDAANGAVYGRLYNWYAVHDPRGLAPTGWHIPSDLEWTTVSTSLGSNAKNAGGKMKETGSAHWLDPNVNSTNSSGFTALGAGYRDELGQFAYINFLSYWWSSTPNGPLHAWCRRLVSYGGFMDRMAYERGQAFSVRCVKD